MKIDARFLHRVLGVSPLIAQRDAAVAERDTAIAERDAAIAERDAVLRAWTDFLTAAPAEVSPHPVAFQCNVCGTHNLAPMSQIGRETASCRTCRSTVRWRTMVYLLSLALHQRGIPLPDFPADPSVAGVGLSDWGGYADPLASKYRYRNTFFHSEPKLDITDPPDSMRGSLDFVISSDVFEHVLPPVSKAFVGAFNILKPGGHLILSVPSSPDCGTHEHYPQARAYSAVEVSGEIYVVVRNQDGTCIVDQKPTFHGGPGDVLEMRWFGDNDLLDELTRAGFADIRVCTDPVPAFGLYFERYGRPILARKPLYLPAADNTDVTGSPRDRL